jgi:hypothetical protein
VNYNGTIAQSVSGITYGHLVFTNGTTNAKTLAASATVAGDLTINSGATFSGGAFTLSISGNWTNSGTFTPSTSTVNLSGTSKNINGNTAFNKLTIFGSYTVPGNDLTTNGLFYIPTGGTLASTTGTLTISGDITNNGTFTSTGTTTFTGTVVQTIQFSNATTTLNVVNFNGTVSPTISSTSASTYSTVNINNTGGVTANISWTTTTAFNIASGASFNGGSATHNYNGSFTNNGSASTSGTFNFTPSATQTIKLAGTSFSSTGTLIFGGTGAIAVTGTPNTLTNVTVSNSTGVTPSANWTMGGSFSINSSSIFNAGSYSYVVAGDILSAGTLNGGTSSFTMSSGSGTLSGSNGTTFYDFTISGTITAIADFNVAHNFTNNGSYDGTAATLTMTGSTASVIGGTATTYNLAQLSIQKSTGVATTLAHNILAVSSLDITSGILDASTYTITQNAGDLFILDNATLKIGGTNSLPAFTTYSLDTLSTVEYYGSTQSVSAATSYGNLTISTTGSKTAAAALTIKNNFTLTTGTYVGGSFTHTVSGNWSMSSGTFTNTGTTILFNGTANQTVTSTGAFNHITVNKPTGDIVLGGNISLSGTLTFTQGKITTGSYIVITTSGTVSGAAQSTGWVNGKMQRTFSTGTNVAGTFYVGGAIYYSPVTITFASVTGGGAITVGNTDGAHPNLPASGISADKNIPRYWTITNTGSVAFTTYTVSLTWNTAENYAGLNTTLLKVGKYTSSTWSFPTITGTPTTSNIQANGINTFGDFVCGQTCDVTAGFSYTGTPYCSNAGTVTITLSGGATSGVFNSTPAGLSINSSSGAVTLGTSTAGTYTVTNTATGTGGCTTAATTTIVITTAPSATISYAGTPYCSNSGTGTVTRTGTAGGTYSSTAGLTISSATGAITTGTSTAGTYTVTYTVAAAGGCSLYTTTTSVTITTAPSATISYAGTPFCSNAGTGTVTQTGTTGGTYSSTAGLSINSSTGAITTGTSTAGTYTITYTIAAAGGCSLFSTTTSVTITALPSATISYSSSPYCKLAGTATVTRTGTTGGTYSSTAGLTIDTNSGDINTGTSTVGTYTVTYTVTGGGCSLYTTTTSVSIVTAGTWTGAVSNNWNTSGNWLCGTVPTSAINATIPTGLSVYPTISSGTGAVNNITIQTGASLTVSGATLQVAGSISNSGTFTASNGTIEMNGSSAQTIPAGVFAGNVIKDLTINNNAGVTLAGTLNMSNELTVSNGSLTTGGYLKLLSTDTTTARVARITSAAGTPISGNVTVERYIKGRRKYRLITSSVTTSASTTLTSGQEGLSIWGNWQNQANNSTANTGTFITGGSAADGFDQQTPNASLFTYNSTTRLFEGFTTANGKNTKYTPLKAGVPYYMFVYGDRTNTTITSTPNKTVLSATGTLLTGDQTYTTSSAIPLSNTTGGYTMLGNPFASPIDWGTVSRTNLSDTYWGWDPNLNSTGGYVTVSTTGTTTLISPFSGSVGLNQYIQSGQGFFVKTTAASPVLTIRETDKVNNFNGIAFRTGTNNISLMAVNLIYDDAAGPMLMDGALAAFDPSFSNQVGNEDASKIIKSGEGLAMGHQSALLSIDARKMPVNRDTLFINTTSLTKPQYRLQIFAKQMDSSTLEPYLEDTYLNTSKLLSLVDTNYVTFTVNSAIPASAGPNRFRIVFRQSGDLSGIISSIRAVKENLGVKVNWDVSSENGVQKYELQRADAANSFTRLGEVMATGNNTSQNYQQIDNSPASGTNYYRVKVIMTDGTTFFSRVVNVIVDEQKTEMKIFPNPVQHHEIKMQFINLEKGKYSARLFNAKGQLVMEQVIDYNGGSANHLIQIDKQIIAGMYFFQLTNGKTKLNQTIIIE